MRVFFFDRIESVWLATALAMAFFTPALAGVVAGVYQAAESTNPPPLLAHWISLDTVVWKAELPADAEVWLRAGEGGGGDGARLKPDPGGLSPAQREKWPHLTGRPVFRWEAPSAELAKSWLKGPVSVVALRDGAALDRAGLQIPGVLDELFAAAVHEELGAVFFSGVPTLKVWAPTARSVRVRIFDGPSTEPPERVESLSENPATGVWSVIGALDWDRKYYLYEVEVYSPVTGRVERNLVTDPYSLSLSADGKRSQIVRLSDPDLQPPGWGDLGKPALAGFRDIVVYELHVRDFSVHDWGVPEALRGTFRAFAEPGSHGRKHLEALAQAGLTHVHLLPAFDFATVPERREDQRTPEGDLASFPPDSQRQQEAVERVKEIDGFNWGYDPLHYTVPEGSYATDPDGPARIREFREMVRALNGVGLRVVMDVVYNHTHAAGQDDRAVLDRIVPGYYHRLEDDGSVANSSCCANTATEHAMMEKLMVDSLLTWARDYKIDGFRFDLMGHHMKSNMQKVRHVLDSLTPARDGVDGARIYVYGEGWDFGEVAGNSRGVNATQANMAGSGIGTFNDRLRDGVRGGTPFSSPLDQGFATGLHDDSNGSDQGDEKEKLLRYADWIRLGLAGNLADFEWIDAYGQPVSGGRLDYLGSPAGYTRRPQENVVYVSAHDNETLFDAIQMKAAAGTSLQERVRMHKLAISVTALAQGVPFFHAGVEMLRSKSMDRDSFNSGDWFNKLDFTRSSNNWGVGLPPAEKNRDKWPLMRPLLANPALRPSTAEIEGVLRHFQEMLAIRRSSRLFRCDDAEQVGTRLSFLNTGPGQIPGLIAMRLRDPESGEIAVVLFNARRAAVRFGVEALRGASLGLHSVQRESADPRVRESSFDVDAGEFHVPGRTTAVFVGVRP